MKATELREILHRIDHKGYPAYKDTKGNYQFAGYVLSIDHVQGDPFASPSKVSIHVSAKTAAFPQHLFDSRCRRIALEDYLLRQFGKAVDKVSFQAKGSGKSGLISVSRPGQQMLERSACRIQKDGSVLVRLEIGFPANGRTINARELEKIFFTFLPECIGKALQYQALSKKEIEDRVNLASKQEYIRQHLEEQGLVAFVADGSLLPRESGVSGRPMKGGIAFQSPESLKVSFSLPYGGNITGMGIRKGITLIVGGGYHGKSTLLKALEAGVYNHIPGDGREYVITNDTAMKLRAEDGRSIQKTDISMFIHDLPNGKDTVSFSTEDASGSTSQAANVVEAMEAGSQVFLIDEDTSATNFMIRDELMQRVVQREAEPIVPFIDRVQELYEDFGISTILVAGSSGSYFHKADCILQMDKYEPLDITEFAKETAKEFPLAVQPVLKKGKLTFSRKPLPEKSWQGERRLKIKTQGRDGICMNHDVIDVRYVEQLVDHEQLSTLAYLLKYAGIHSFDGRKTLQQVVQEVFAVLQKGGMEQICQGSYLPCNFAYVREQELYACINRYRNLKIQK